MHDLVAKSPPGGAVSDWYNFISNKNHNSLLVFYCNSASIMHRFIYNEVLKLTRNDVTATSPLDVVVSDWLSLFQKKYHYFLLVFYFNCASIMNSLVEKEV